MRYDQNIARNQKQSVKLQKVHQKASAMESLSRKAPSPHTYSCTKKEPSLAFSSEYTYLNIFANCFISIEPSLVDYRVDQCLFNKPSYFNS